eukprot:2689902-Pleurochrysis_carterae.AAC.3
MQARASAPVHTPAHTYRREGSNTHTLARPGAPWRACSHTLAHAHTRAYARTRVDTLAHARISRHMNILARSLAQAQTCTNMYLHSALAHARMPVGKRSHARWNMRKHALCGNKHEHACAQLDSRVRICTHMRACVQLTAQRPHAHVSTCVHLRAPHACAFVHARERANASTSVHAQNTEKTCNPIHICVSESKYA